MIVRTAEINTSGSFLISNQYWRNNLYGLRSEIINSPPAANHSLERNSLLLIKLPWIEWSLWRIQNSIFALTRAYKCKLWTNKLLEASGIKLNSVLENVYDKQKLKTRKAVVSSPYGGEMAASQMRIKMSNSSNSQRITVRTMQKQRVASPPSLTLSSGLAETAATRGTFLLALATQHFFLMLQKLWNQNDARVARGMLCNKITGIMLQNIHRIEFFCIILQILGTPCFTSSTSVAE